VVEDDGTVTVVQSTRRAEVKGESAEDRRRVSAMADPRFTVNGGRGIERLAQVIEKAVSSTMAAVYDSGTYLLTLSPTGSLSPAA